MAKKENMNYQWQGGKETVFLNGGAVLSPEKDSTMPLVLHQPQQVAPVLPLPPPALW